MLAFRSVFAAVFLILLGCVSAGASHLVTGNGYGFAVVAPDSGAVTSFYAHPYSFVRPDAAKPLSEGVATANFLKQISWRGGSAANPSADYDQDSHVIRIHRADGDGVLFMPFGLRRPVLILAWNPSEGASQGGLEVEWRQPVDSQRRVRVGNQQLQLLRFKGVDESLLLIPVDREQRVKSDLSNAQDPLRESNSWALISLESDSDATAAAAEFSEWRAGLDAKALAAREIAELERWRVKPPVHFTSEAERHLWRQSEVMLRIAQSREPNRPGRHGNGLIVASLPDGVWSTPWVRDMAWATVALARMGHQAEARAAVLAYFDAQPTGKMRAQTAGADYQISVVRYWGDGAEEPFFTEEGATNIEFDDWGEALWAWGEYMKKYDDRALLKTATFRGPLYESARDFIVRPLMANTEPYGGGRIVAADTSIWEEHQKDKKHFAFSTAAAIFGLRAFADVAGRAGDEAGRAKALREVAELQKGFDAAFIRGGKLHGTLEEGEKNDIDGALLPIIHFDIVTDPAVIRDTVDRMELLKVASGGYRRVRSNYTDPAIFEYWYERQEFLFVDFSLAEVDRRLGREAESGALLKRVVDKAAADHDIIPEMYVAVPCKLFPGEVGDPTGALPMVGYGAGEYVLDLLDRDEGK